MTIPLTFLTGIAEIRFQLLGTEDFQKYIICSGVHRCSSLADPRLGLSCREGK
jgi:hypothetical protein